MKDRTMPKQLETWLESIRAADFGYLSEEPFLVLGAIALGLLLLLLLLRLRPPSRIKAFKGETGYVEISRHALLDLVHSACEQLPEVRKPSIKVRARRKLDLSVRIRVDGSAHLRDTASYLQSHLKDALENNLGVERLGKIRILVTGVRSASSRKVDLNQRGGEQPKPDAGKPSAPSPKPASEATSPKPASEAPAPAGSRPAAPSSATPEKPSPTPAGPAAPGTAASGRPADAKPGGASKAKEEPPGSPKDPAGRTPPKTDLNRPAAPPSDSPKTPSESNPKKT
jgi:hypothetical protein